MAGRGRSAALPTLAAVDVRVEIISDGDGWVVATLRGDLDLSSLPALRRAVASLPTADRGVIVDLDPVEVLEPEALGVLLGLAARLRRQGGDLRVVTTAEQQLELLALTGVDRALRVHGSIAAAVDD